MLYGYLIAFVIIVRDETAKKQSKFTLSQSVTKVCFDNFSVKKSCDRVVFSLLIYPVLFLQEMRKFEQL